MRILIFFLTLLTYGNIVNGQSIVGSWHWSDSLYESSLFIKANGVIEKYSDRKGSNITDKNTKNGVYTLNGNKLQIVWENGLVEKYRVKFLDKYTFKLYDVAGGNKVRKQYYLYRKVVDIEVSDG